MRVLIVGATGNIGQLTVDKALEAGHSVTAFARSPDKLKDNRVRKVQGDLMDASAIDAAMSGQEVAIAVFGAPLNLSTLTNVPDLCTTGTRYIIEAMKKHGVRRLVCMTGIGAGDSRRHGRFMYRNVILPLLLGRIYRDKDRQEQEVKSSNLDWIIVRPAGLTDEPGSGNYRVLTNLEGQFARKIPRRDVADFLVKQIDSNDYLHQTPLITQ